MSTAAEEELAVRVPELRGKFVSKYKENSKRGLYDLRDVDRLAKDDEYAKCFIRAYMEKKSIDKAVDMIDVVFKYRKEIAVNDINVASIPKELVSKQFIYWKGVDIVGHKLLHYRVSRQKRNIMTKEAKQYVAYFLEQYQRENLGDRVVVIVDFTDAGVTETDLEVSTFLITSVTSGFPCILAYIILFEMPFLMSTIWMVMKSVLSTEEQQKKITQVTKNEMQSYVNVSELEPHMYELSSKVPQLREKFFLKYEVNVKNKLYDFRDLDKLKTNDSYAKCFIKAFMEKGSLDKPIEMIDTVLKFRKEIAINDMTLQSFPQEVLQRNAFYWHGVDKERRKILYFRVTRHKKGVMLSEARNYLAFLLEQQHKERPEDEIAFIFDFTEAGVTNMDVEFTKFIFTCLSTYFPSIQAYILLYEMSMLLATAWKVIKSWLTEEQQKKVIMVRKTDIKTYIDAIELEPHMSTK